MTKYGQTYNFKASDHVKWILKYVDNLDYIIVNNAKLSHNALEIYKKYLEEPVIDDLNTQINPKIIRADVVSNKIIKKLENDKLVRSLIRHDSEKLANTIQEIINNEV